MSKIRAKIHVTDVDGKSFCGKFFKHTSASSSISFANPKHHESFIDETFAGNRQCIICTKKLKRIYTK